MSETGDRETHRDRLPEGLSDVLRRVRRLSRENERLFGELAAGERRLHRMARAVWQVQEEERRRLARELHDGVGQTLTALKNLLGWLREKEDAREVEAGLGEALEIAARALQETREMSRLLRPAVLDDLGLEAALRGLVRAVARPDGLQVGLDLEPGENRLPAAVETVLYRVAQEALSNVVRHSGAKRARLSLSRTDRRVRLSIEDDGRGFDPRQVFAAGADSGIGLRGIRDRTALFGGSFDIVSRDGGGMRLSVELPVEEAGA